MPKLGFLTWKPSLTWSYIFNLPSSASTVWPLPWGRQEPAWLWGRRSHGRTKNSSHFPQNWSSFDCLFLFARFVFKVCCWTNSETLAPKPSISKHPWDRQLTPGSCSWSGLTISWAGWRCSEGSRPSGPAPCWPPPAPSSSLSLSFRPFISLPWIASRKGKKKCFLKRSLMKSNTCISSYWHWICTSPVQPFGTSL